MIRDPQVGHKMGPRRPLEFHWVSTLFPIRCWLRRREKEIEHVRPRREECDRLPWTASTDPVAASQTNLSPNRSSSSTCLNFRFPNVDLLEGVSVPSTASFGLPFVDSQRLAQVFPLCTHAYNAFNAFPRDRLLDIGLISLGWCSIFLTSTFLVVHSSYTEWNQFRTLPRSGVHRVSYDTIGLMDQSIRIRRLFNEWKSGRTHAFNNVRSETKPNPSQKIHGKGIFVGSDEILQESTRKTLIGFSVGELSHR